MKLDTHAFRHLSAEDWRVLTAVGAPISALSLCFPQANHSAAPPHPRVAQVEMGSRNHEVVPTPLIVQIANLRGGAGLAHRAISTITKANLIARQRNVRYDGYRLTYGGLDYLALHAHSKARAIGGIGSQIGTGKESDIYLCNAPTEAGQRNGPGAGRNLVLKLHRLGRTSFRTVKTNRDYLRNRHTGSWMYMSRLAAIKEHAFMRVLRDAGFRVPEPVAVNRHALVMSLVDGTPLRMVEGVPDVPALYAELMEMVVRLAGVGLIHGDFNEFNIMIVEEEEEEGQGKEKKEVADVGGATIPPEADVHNASTALTSSIRIVPILIDFPQMVSTSHMNAQMYFDRDVACVKRFFKRRFGFTSSDHGPTFDYAMKQARAQGEQRQHLDIEVEASGFSRKMAKDLEKYMKEVGVDGDGVDAETGEGVVASEGEEDLETSDGLKDASSSEDVLEPSLHDDPKEVL